MSTNLMLGINFTLLAADLSAAYLKLSNGYRILLKPTSPETNKGMTIGEMIEDVNKMITQISGGTKLTQKEVTDKLSVSSTAPKDDAEWQSIRFKLSMVYLNIQREGTVTKVMDFAFKLDVDASNLFPQVDIVKISKLCLAVWNTEDKAIMEQMNLALLKAENLAPAPVSGK